MADKTEQPQVRPAGIQQRAIRPDGSLLIGTVQVNGTTSFEVSTAVSLAGGGRDVLLGAVRMSRGMAGALATILTVAAKEG